ncbi:molybdopterin converting factor subunit 1 [Polymorphobacter sp.]|uniref:molybdopterin converting factor subunit 1 n=1 Tax=Polymorphobacter sp. TaxID=1909290 RepID=UPI003F6FB442
MTILYFAWVREMVGANDESVELPPQVATVGELLDWLATRSGGHGSALADRSRIRTALDDEFATLDTVIGDARELAIFPPVTGG